ncbi:MAG: hypothetical protein ACXADH_01855 [Candidatus Kariarchaeaceae archaeon]
MTWYTVVSNPNPKLVLILRGLAGLVWFGTVIRRLSPNYGDFENRIASMSEGSTILPDPIMELAVDHWFIVYLVVISIEAIISISLLTGTLARGGALLATVNGFLIGMAGIGISTLDLVIPWSVALLTLYLFLFSHPGRFRGVDQYLQSKDLPRLLIWLT